MIEENTCSDCPPFGYPNDKTRCLPCPRRAQNALDAKESLGGAIFPMQCSCGHIFLEKYQYHKPLTDGRIGFCWCGFCRNKTFVTDSSRQSAILGNGGDSGSDAKPPLEKP